MYGLTISTMIRNLMKQNIGCCNKQINALTYISSRTFYNKYRHGPTALTNPKFDYIAWFKEAFSVEGFHFVKDEAIKVFKERNKKLQGPKTREFDKLHIFEHFDSDESIKRWRAVADSDGLCGYSVSRFTRSAQGNALFSGIIDNRVPDDGVTQYSGMAGVIGPKRQREKFFSIENSYKWTGFNAIEMRIRGDGRKYLFVISTGSRQNDLSYYDNYCYPIYTTGGPYWQTITIPISKLIFSAKGLIQDEQGWIDELAIKFVAIALQDQVSGPFSLEIDYMGLKRQLNPFNERTAYEMYTFPHIRFRQIQTDCSP